MKSGLCIGVSVILLIVSFLNFIKAIFINEIALLLICFVNLIFICFSILLEKDSLGGKDE